MSSVCVCAYGEGSFVCIWRAHLCIFGEGSFLEGQLDADLMEARFPVIDLSQAALKLVHLLLNGPKFLRLGADLTEFPSRRAVRTRAGA